MSTCFASIYSNEEALKKGIERGKGGQDKQCRSVGYIFLLDRDGQIVAEGNGTLISSNAVLTCAHLFPNEIFEREKEVAGYFALQDEVSEYFISKQNAGNVPKSKYCNPDARSTLSSISQLHLHPKEDLAILHLEKEFPEVPILPILDKNPKRWKNGFLTSFSEARVAGKLGKEQPPRKRHLAIVEINKLKKSFNISEKPYLCTNFIVHNQGKKKGAWIPSIKSHPLEAMAKPGDSGAPLMVKANGKLHIAGIFNSIEDHFSHVPEPIIPIVHRYIPLFFYTKWIQSTTPTKQQPHSIERKAI